MTFISRIILSHILLPFALHASTSDNLIQWNEDPKFAIEINGKVDLLARAFQPFDFKPYIIIMTKALKQTVMMNLTTKEVFTLDQSVFKKKDEISVFTEKIPSGKKIGSYKLDKGVSVFAAESKKISVRIKESLVGEVPLSIVLAHSPVYALLRDQYIPNKKSLDFIKAYSKKTDLVVMFATWCPTCKHVVPQLLRILKDANNVSFSARFIGIAMGGSEPHDLLEQYGHDYPACIFFDNGKEKGRIVGAPPVPLEDAIVAVLKK